MPFLTSQDIYNKKTRGEKIVMLTAYDYPFARILDNEKIDMILVGDSLGMVLLGYETTLPVTMEDMLHHTKAAARAVKHTLLIADMPFGSYDTAKNAVKNAKRFTKVGARAVKLEGGKRIENQLKALIKAGIPVMGHVGMTPQSVEKFGGYKVQGKDKKQAQKIIEDAILLDRLGAFAVVVECVPAMLGTEITRKVRCPTIGIGAGAGTDGQVLVLHDMLGFESGVHPRFVRRYADLEKSVRKAVHHYRKDVISGKFPSKEESY